MPELIAKPQWWRLFINPRDHETALARFPDDPGSYYDNDLSPGYQRSMTEAYENILAQPDAVARRVDSSMYEQMHDLVTRYLDSDTRWSGGGATNFPLRAERPSPDILDETIDGRPLLYDLKNHDWSKRLANPGRIITIIDWSSFNNPTLRSNYQQRDVRQLVDSVFDRYYDEISHADSDPRARLDSIARAIRALHVIHPFSDGNLRLDVQLLLPKLLLEQGFNPVVPAGMHPLFQGGYSINTIVDTLVANGALPTTTESPATTRTSAAADHDAPADLDGVDNGGSARRNPGRTRDDFDLSSYERGASSSKVEPPQQHVPSHAATQRSSWPNPTEPSRPVPVGADFLDPDVTVRARDDQGRDITVRVTDLAYRMTPRDGNGIGLSFTLEDKFTLTGDHNQTVRTLPGETPAEAAEHTKRPATHRDGTTADVYAESAKSGYKMPLWNGKSVTMDAANLATAVTNFGELQYLAAIDPELKFRMLTSHNEGLKDLAKELHAAGFDGSVEGTLGEVSQLPDGRFGVADNKGWVEYPKYERARVNDVYSEGNLANIAFFEEHLADAAYILDADEPLVGHREDDGSEFRFYPHEMTADELTTDSTGWSRTNGLTMMPTAGERFSDRLLADKNDELNAVARTRKGELGSATTFDENGRVTDLFDADPLDRLAEHPAGPVETTLVHPGTGARVRAVAASNIISVHGTKDHAQITVERGGSRPKLNISGETLAKAKLQRSEFHQMYRANPDGKLQYLICHAAEGTKTGFADEQPADAATLMRDSVRTARTFGVKNTYVAAGDAIAATAPIAVANNAGLVSSYLKNGREYIEAHENTRYTDAELENLPNHTPRSTHGFGLEHDSGTSDHRAAAEDGSGVFERGARQSRQAQDTVPVDPTFIDPDLRLTGFLDDNTEVEFRLRDIEYHKMPGERLAHGIAFTRGDSFNLTGKYRTTVKTTEFEEPDEAYGKTKRPGAATRDGDHETFHFTTEGHYLPKLPLRDGKDVGIVNQDLATVLANLRDVRYMQALDPDFTMKLLTPNYDLDQLHESLRKHKFSGTLTGPATTLGAQQLPDGSLSTPNNHGWVEHSPAGRRETHKYSDANLQNISFFEKFLPDARKIPNADEPLVGYLNGTAVKFYPREMVQQELTSHQPGWKRVNGMLLVHDTTVLRNEKHIASAADVQHGLIMTRPGESLVDIDHDTPEGMSLASWLNNGPIRRWEPAPYAPEPTTLINPQTGQPTQFTAGPNTIVSHGDGDAAQISVRRKGEIYTLSVSPETFTEAYVQQSPFHRMYRANPNAKLLYAICLAAEGTVTGPATAPQNASSFLARSVRTAREDFDIKNTYVAARAILVAVGEGGYSRSADDNQGWASSYLKHGHEHIKVHEETRFSADELKTIPKFQPQTDTTSQVGDEITTANLKNDVSHRSPDHESRALPYDDVRSPADVERSRDDSASRAHDDEDMASQFRMPRYSHRPPISHSHRPPISHSHRPPPDYLDLESDSDGPAYSDSESYGQPYYQGGQRPPRQSYHQGGQPSFRPARRPHLRAAPATTPVPVNRDLINPEVQISGINEAGRKVSVPAHEFEYRWMRGRGIGLSFTQYDTFTLDGKYRELLMTIPGEEARDAYPRDHKRPGEGMTETAPVFHGYAINDGRRYSMPLRNGETLRVSAVSFSRLLRNFQEFHDLSRAHDDLAFRMLSPKNKALRGVAEALGDTVHSVAGTFGHVSQARDGRFSANNNAGWTEYTHRGDNKTVLGVYNDGNIANINFFERYLPEAAYIPDNEKLHSARTSDGSEYRFYADHVYDKNFYSRDTGWRRPNGTSLLIKPGELNADDLLARNLDRAYDVARTKPGETRPPDHYDWAEDPDRRKTESPFPPRSFLLVNPNTGALVQAIAGSNFISTHGTVGQNVTLNVVGEKDDTTVLTDGITFMEVLVQLPAFQRMYAANPNADILFMICHAGKDAETGYAREQNPGKAMILRGSVAAARQLGLRNTFHAGRDTTRLDVRPETANNAGWVSSYYNSGNEYMKVHDHTRYRITGYRYP